jgi:hypothetical protein
MNQVYEWKWMLPFVNTIVKLHVVFTFYIAYIIFYWTIAISNGVGCLWQMVQTRATEDADLDIPKGSASRGRADGQAPRGNPPLPPPLCLPVSIEELLAKKNELMSVPVQNEACHGVECPQHHHH